MIAAPDLDTRNLNSLWCSVLAETLARTGVARAVISPGSRSTPLTMALVRHGGIECVPVLDERSAAFFALGLARRTMTPVALVCTSGTAGANYFPAIIEAQEGGVPLLVLTADRPPELRACASGQTIDQQKLYGAHVNFFHELPVPALDETLFRALRQTVAHAVERTLLPGAGPAHLNAPFRDPLAPLEDDSSASHFAAGIDWERFFARLARPAAASLHAVAPRFVTEVHGLIVAGPAQPADAEAHAKLVGEVATRLGWPVLADALSPLRNFAAVVPHLVTTYDLILRNHVAAERLKPEAVLCLGEWPTSKILRAWLTRHDAPTLLVAERADNRDALHARARHLPCSLAAFAAQLSPATGDTHGYARLWSSFEHKARTALDDRLRETGTLFEGKVAWLLAQHLPPGTPLAIANSMPVRDAEYFWPANDRGVRPAFSRGANGIDGTLSTALGLAHGADRPAVLLTGDLALLHDSNGFLLAPKFRGALTIVLINNRGGGIFGHLPVAAFDPPFEEFFATPQSVEFATLCEAHGVDHVFVHDWAHFVAVVSELPPHGIRVLEVSTDRKADAATRQAMFADLAAKLSEG